jgi:hypothetical protein
LQTSELRTSGARASPESTRRMLVPLAGAAILVAFALASLPRAEDLLRRPRTPFDRSASYPATPVFALLSAAARVIPPTASVVVQTEPRDASRETYDYRFAVALLPERTVLPASEYDRFLPPSVWDEAEYLVVLGGRPPSAPGELVLETSDGTLWKRRRQ